MDQRAAIVVTVDLTRGLQVGDQVISPDFFGTGEAVDLNSSDDLAAKFLVLALAHVALSQETADALVQLDDGRFRASNPQVFDQLVELVRVMIQGAAEEALVRVQA
jgi:hypothetical protein